MMISPKPTAVDDQLPLTNQRIAGLMLEVAELLEAQGANPYRVRAYRTAAGTLQQLSRSVHEILETDDLDGLVRLQGIGQSLSRSIEQLCHTGRLALLERLRGDTTAEDVFATATATGP